MGYIDGMVKRITWVFPLLHICNSNPFFRALLKLRLNDSAFAVLNKTMRIKMILCSDDSTLNSVFE